MAVAKLYTALKATSLTLAEVLRQHFKADATLRLFFDSAAGGTMLISLCSPRDMIDNTEQGVSLWLYRVIRDGERLNEPMERISRSQYRLRPLPLSLQYLVTPIIGTRDKHGSPETEQMILGKVIQVFHDHPILGGVSLQDDFTNTEVELHIHMEPVSVDENSRIFDALEQSYRLSLSYQVSMVMVDSEHEPFDTAAVQSPIADFALRVGG